jgi:hypothetical protein
MLQLKLLLYSITADGQSASLSWCQARIFAQVQVPDRSTLGSLLGGFMSICREVLQQVIS